MRSFLGIAASSFVVAALFLTGTRPAVGQDDKKTVEPDPGKAHGGLPQEVIAAWEKAGAETGWMGPRWQLGMEFSKDRVGFDLGRTVPAFRFGRFGTGWPEELAKLPAPEQAFGYELSGATDEKVKELARLRHLTSLHLKTVPLSASKFTEAGLKELAGMKQLTALHLNVGSPLVRGNRPFTDADLKVLAGMTQLTALELPFTQVTDEGLKELAGMKQLTSLHLTNNKQITDAGLKELAGLERLTDLKLNMTRVTDAGLKELAPLKQLTILGLWYTQVTDAGLKELAGLEHLTMLTLSNTQVTGTGLKELTGLKRLTFLEFKGSQVTEDGLKELAGLQHLTTLYLTKTPVTEAGEEALRKALPQCRIRLVNGPRVVPGAARGGGGSDPPVSSGLRGLSRSSRALAAALGRGRPRLTYSPTGAAGAARGFPQDANEQHTSCRDAASVEATCGVCGEFLALRESRPRKSATGSSRTSSEGALRRRWFFDGDDGEESHGERQAEFHGDPEAAVVGLVRNSVSGRNC